VSPDERDPSVSVEDFIGDSVSNKDSLEVDVSVGVGVSEHDLLSQSGDVDSSVALSGDIEVVLLEFGISVEEVQ